MKKKSGRPSVYAEWLTEDKLRVIRMWKRAGLTDRQIARKIGVRDQTISEWKRRFPQFSDAFKNGKEEADASAEDALVALFQKQTLRETRIEEWVSENGEKRTHTTTVFKEVPPVPAAIIFYLKAKCGWRDNCEITDTTAIEKLDELLRSVQAQAEEENDGD